jgi:hypothetical protein
MRRSNNLSVVFKFIFKKFYLQILQSLENILLSSLKKTKKKTYERKWMKIVLTKVWDQIVRRKIKNLFVLTFNFFEQSK